MVRDAKVVLDVNKTRQIAQEMVKVKQLNTDTPEHFDSTHYIKKQLHFSLSLGDGLPPCEGDLAQRHEVQECVL